MSNRNQQFNEEDVDVFSDYTLERKDRRRNRQNTKKNKASKKKRDKNKDMNEFDDLSYEEFFGR
jgi:hypothetical protein